MPTKQIEYECNICKTKHKDLDSAVQCEKSHTDLKDYSITAELPGDSVFPDTITVERLGASQIHSADYKLLGPESPVE